MSERRKRRFYIVEFETDKQPGEKHYVMARMGWTFRKDEAKIFLSPGSALAATRAVQRRMNFWNKRTDPSSHENIKTAKLIEVEIVWKDAVIMEL